ncbi:MAG: glycoside hydrolase family 3 N-terminal domain-containing protein, partial [Exiguobacterium indicum]
MKKIGQFTLTAGLAAVLVSSSLPVMAEAGSSADRISQKIDTMTLEQKIGQMIMPDFRQWDGSNHTSLSPEVANIIDRYDLGGVILFAENVSETEQTTKLVHDLQEVVKQDDS